MNDQERADAGLSESQERTKARWRRRKQQRDKLRLALASALSEVAQLKAELERAEADRRIDVAMEERRAEAAEQSLARIRKAAGLRRNTRWAPDKELIGEWVCVPKEDFDALAAALSEAPATEGSQDA